MILLATSTSIETLIQIDRASSLSLQEQIRQGVVRAIEMGIAPAGSRLPSTRKLADRLGISRNTALIAYDRLIADGHIVSRDRSGLFVAEGRVRPQAWERQVIDPDRGAPVSVAARYVTEWAKVNERFQIPSDWQSYKFPFLEGRYDRSLFPVHEWREASRLALGVAEVEAWSVDAGEADDTHLIEEIRTKILPRRGIEARQDELLITSGTQQALHLVSRLFVGTGVNIGVENPGLPQVRALFAGRGAILHHIPVDDNGLIVDAVPDECRLLHTTPSRQQPTAVTLSMERREALMQLADSRGMIIVEEDTECELNYLASPLPALHAMDRTGRIIYVASLSKVLAPGVGLGFMVGPPEIIAAARRLRGLTTGRPSPNNQRAAAFFLSLGHYDAMLRRLRELFAYRLIALRDALNHYRPQSIAINPVGGGTTYWVRGPDNLDSRELVRVAQARGVLIEPVDQYFAAGTAPKNLFRLGVTSLPQKSIRNGIAELSQAMLSLADAPAIGRRLADKCLGANDIKNKLAGVRLLYRTVYGEPCTIFLNPSGSMTGVSGEDGEDRDEGAWWVEGDIWYRRWNRWAYGETVGYHVVIEGDELSWLDSDRKRVDGAVIVGRT